MKRSPFSAQLRAGVLLGLLLCLSAASLPGATPKRRSLELARRLRTGETLTGKERKYAIAIARKHRFTTDAEVADYLEYCFRRSETLQRRPEDPSWRKRRGFGSSTVSRWHFGGVVLLGILVLGVLVLAWIYWRVRMCPHTPELHLGESVEEILRSGLEQPPADVDASPEVPPDQGQGPTIK